MSLYRQIFFLYGFFLPELLCGSLVDHVAFVNDRHAIRNGHGEPDVLLGEKNGRCLLFQAHEEFLESANDNRRQSFGRFVENEHVRIAHKGPGDGEHLLFAPGQRAPEALQHVTEKGEVFQHGIKIPVSLAPGNTAQLEVFP